jgi:hypothetical protein
MKWNPCESRDHLLTELKLLTANWSKAWVRFIGRQNYTIHQDTEAFPQPEKFLPQRWLEKDTSLQKAEFNGFGTRPKPCIGRI